MGTNSVNLLDSVTFSLFAVCDISDAAGVCALNFDPVLLRMMQLQPASDIANNATVNKQATLSATARPRELA